MSRAVVQGVPAAGGGACNACARNTCAARLRAIAAERVQRSPCVGHKHDPIGESRIFRRGDFGNPSERALKGIEITA